MTTPIHHSSRKGGPWTDARVAQLTELWLDGVSARLIAKQMDLSKNAVIGKAHRLELPNRPSPIVYSDKTSPKKESLTATTKPAKATVRKPSPHPVMHLAHPNSKTGTARGIATFPRVALDARIRGCQWIAGEPSADDACKCGAAVGETRIYCPEHEIKARRTKLAWGEAA